MLSLQTERIASSVLPKRKDSHVGVKLYFDNADLCYFHYVDRYFSDIFFNYTGGPQINYVHTLLKKSLDMKINLNHDSSVFITYHPFLSHQFCITKVFKDVLNTRLLSIPTLSFDIDTVNGLCFKLENKSTIIRDSFLIRTKSTYVSNVICNDIKVDLPFAEFAVFISNNNIMMSSIRPKIDRISPASACFSCAFAHNKFSSALAEFSLNKYFLHKIFNESKFVDVKSEKTGVKLDSGNKLVVFRQELEASFNNKKTFILTEGAEVLYRPDNFRISAGVVLNYNRSKNNSWQLSLGKTADSHFSGKLCYKMNKAVQLEGGVVVGPMFTKLPSINYSASVSFFDLKEKEKLGFWDSSVKKLRNVYKSFTKMF